MEVNIEQIRPSPYQPRLHFEIAELKEEIKRDGLLSPLVVRLADGYYELIDGERRLRVLKELGQRKIPVTVAGIDDKKARLMVWKLNSVRENYSIEEKAQYIKKLHDSGMTAYAIAQELGFKDDNIVRAYINIFKFPEHVQRAVFEGKPSIGQIQDMETLILENIDRATEYAEMIIDKSLTMQASRELLRKEVDTIQQMKLEKARKELGAYAPKALQQAKLNTPEDKENLARYLLKQAKEEKLKQLPPEQLREIEEKKKAKTLRRVHKYREERRHDEEEMEKRLEAERKRIEEEAKKKAREEALRDPDFVKELRKSLTNAPSLVEIGRTQRLVSADQALEPSTASIITEVNTGYIFRCPVCKDSYQIYHLKPTDSHTFRGVDEE